MRNERTSRALTLGLCGGYFLVLLDVTIVNVALPQIGTGLHAGASGLAWVVDAYTVPLAALLLACGAIGDLLGHRRVVVAGFAGFGAASVVCALAPGLGWLIAGRAAQGVCAALMLPGTLALLADTAPDEAARARAVGLWAAVGGAALPAGPLVGGLLVETGQWRAVFWVNVPVIVVALAAVLWGSQRSRRSQGSYNLASDAGEASAERGVPWSDVPWAGAAALVVMLACAVTAVVQVRDEAGLSAVMLAMTVVAAVAFRFFERRSARPLLQVEAAARRPLAAACAVAGLMNFCVLGSLFLMTQVLQDTDGLSPLRAGALLLPGMLPLPLLGTTAGRLTTRFGPWRTSTVGLFLAAAGFVGIATGIDGPDLLRLLPALAVWGTGLSILTPAIVAAALRTLPAAPGIASGASNTARQTGAALGVAVFSALAGTATANGFVRHAAWLLTASAVAFVAVALISARSTAVAKERAST
ncbi:major facilitator superfamily MFS_1 [Catenulispora acidiphila DSM 44928]|uniref:Major facilitator superfamily MFS_1 n=1 Tax=Catenulispora acidiphila (strain DSM 44928 / JCM 14897 / NBRC 102108 / NRRL B-24433 / ID139908) TaxID=479433 RepID=C7PXH3_CATAD|nr:MFS transporter [Catenulispora acidiphila]ACU71426.1 major facilitator superfamily MFS_1 [Catenulispora acidiphila DSM 44928]